MLRHGMVLFALGLSVLTDVHGVRGQSPQSTSANPPADPRIVAIPYSVSDSLRDRNGRTLWGDPDLSPGNAPLGWFAGVQVNLVGPAISQRVIGQVTRGADVVDVILPTAPLNWAGAPQIDFGYRFPNALGELTASYRLLATQGSSVIAGFDGAGSAALRSRLDAHVAYLDYTSREFSLWPLWDMKAHVGVCLPSIFFDSQATGSLRAARTSSNYFGAGPHLGFDFWRHLPIAGLSLYARTGMNLTVGHVHQRFDETLASPGGPITSGESELRKVREVPMAQLQVGLSYTPPLPNQQLRLSAGYTLERWWYLAQTDESRGELTVQGLFLKLDWGY